MNNDISNVSNLYIDSDLGLDYNKIQSILFKLLKFKPMNYNYQNTYTKEDVITITSDFFKSLGDDYFNFYNSIIKSNRITIDYGIESGHKDERITVNLEGSLHDVYILIHEIMHEYNIDSDNIITDSFTGEIIPITFEKIVTKYLNSTKHNKFDVLAFDKYRINNTYNAIVDSLFEIMLIIVRKNYGELTFDNIKKYIKSNPCEIWNNLSDEELISSINNISKYKDMYLYNLRYVIGQLLSVKLSNNNDDDIQLADKLIKFCKEKLDNNTMEKRLKLLDIDINDLSGLLNEYELYYSSIKKKTLTELSNIIQQS